MSKAIKNSLSTPVPQSEQADPRQVKNSAGGYTFTVNDKARLTRFLILGTDGGTYYVGEKKLTQDNINFLRAIIERDETMVIETVREISLDGRAYRNSPAIFAVAALFAWGKTKPQELVREVCRNSTMMFEWADYVDLLGGWGRSKVNAVANWYASQSPQSLAMQVIKYRQRNGRTHRDMLRLSHVGRHGDHKIPEDIANFVLGKGPTTYAESDGINDTIRGFLWAQEALSVDEAMAVMRSYSLPWEAFPTKFHTEPKFWKTLFENGNIQGQALLRNVTRFAKLGLFNDMIFARAFAEKLNDDAMIARTRLHPFQYLLAYTAYERGHDIRDRSKVWTVQPVIKSALDDAFYKAFKYVEPAGKRTMIALDVSASMRNNIPGLEIPSTMITAVMSMTIARTEPYYQIMGFAYDFRDLGIAPSMSLSETMSRTYNHSFGGTDCGKPMTYALERKIAVDTFLIMTDNETWAGNIHPHHALEKYRQAMGIDARMIVAGTEPTPFSIANPSDAGMLDICGADSNLPKLVAEFSAGRI